MSIEKTFCDAIDEVEKVVRIFPFEDKEKYRQFLNQQFYLVRNSTRYLALAASRVNVNERVHFRDWVGHLREEMDHDLLILNDLKTLGTPLSDPVDPLTRSMIATQYSDINNFGPNALLGYALLLEGLSCRVCDSVADRVEKAHGKKTATYLRLHGNVDQDHFPEGMKKISQMDQEQIQIIKMNLESSLTLYLALVNFILTCKPSGRAFSQREITV